MEFIAEEIIMMKAGRVLHFGRPQEITEEIEGYVWECMVPTRYAEQYSGTLNVSNLRIDSVISVLDAGREKFTFQEINLKAELRYKDIIIDLEKREVIRGNRRIVLTYTEFEILQLLAQNPDRVFNKEQIYDMVWHEPSKVPCRT